MPISASDILELLDAEEPDYKAAALVVAGDGFAALEALVQDADVWIAARAAALVASLAADSAQAVACVPVLSRALQHADPGVRAQAALGAARAGEPAQELLEACLRDADAGVRLMAFHGLATPLPPKIAAAVKTLAAADAEPAVKGKAVALAARNPDPALGNELLLGALEYAFARLSELAAAVLGDVLSFSSALGLPGFVDAAGSVALHLAAARAALDLCQQRIAASDFQGAALQLCAALRAVADGAAAVGGSFPELLRAQISWGAAQPHGLAQQLGLPASVPGLEVRDGALVYEIAAPGRRLGVAPFELAFDKVTLTARVALDGREPPLSIALELEGASASLGGGPISSLLGGAVGAVQADLVLSVDTRSGLTLGGGAGPRVVLPARPKLGPIDVRELVLELPTDSPNTIDVSGTITSNFGGVLRATVEGAGLQLRINPAAAVGGDGPLAVSGKAPSGIGLALDAGIIRGGGSLSVRSGGYGGSLQLRLGPVEVQAVGLLTLEPKFALVVVMSVEFQPALDLTFGFTLNAVGGLLGLEHRIDTDALRDGLGSGALDHLLFPADPAAAAPAILSTLEHVFPLESGAIVIGPMIELGWGRPVSYLSAQLGVLIGLPDPRIIIIGRGRVALPAPELPIVDLRALLYGEITADHLLIRVSLNGSRIAGFTVTGDVGLLLRWGGTPELAISAGGFHPRFQPPRELSGMSRLAMNLSPPAILQLRAESYFAVTSNSVQLGSRVEMGADLGIADISGHFAFDALVLFSPKFSFSVDANAGLTVHVLGVTLLGVQLELHLAGPAPWYAQGSAEVEVLWAKKSIDVGPFTWGDADNPAPLQADPRQLARDALHHNPGAWQALVPPDADRVVRLIPAAPSDTEITVHPLGLFEVRQHAIPLETVITHVGPNPVPEDRRRVNLGVPLVDATPVSALSEVTDLFAPGNYLELSEDDKLSRPSFEPMLAGARIRPPGEAADFPGAREAQLRYETFVCDDDAMRGKRSLPLLDVLFASARVTALAAGAASRSELRARTRYDVNPDPIALGDAGESQVLSKRTVAAADPAAWASYSHAAQQPLAAEEQLARFGAA